VERVKEVERDSWASFKARRNTAHMKQLLVSIGGTTWRAERGPAEAGKRRARCRRGTWRGE
jgi:hypothetical protein